jgi:transcriptional regulator with XRE-family HTH domain
MLASPSYCGDDSMTVSMAPVKERTVKGFGKRLREIRRRRGLTQGELGAAVGVSNRVIAYYEQDDAQPPGPLLTELARVLKASTDELLGLQPVKDSTSPRTARLIKRLRRVEELPPADQRAVLKLVDALVTTRRRAGSR